MRQSQATLLADLLLTKRGRLRLTVGGAYQIQNNIDVSIKPATNQGDFFFNSVRIPKDSIGYVNTSFSYQNRVSPYIGFGIGRIMPHKRVNLSFDYGAFYRGKPSATIEATGFLKDNKLNEIPLNRNISSLRWYPVASMRIGIRLF